MKRLSNNQETLGFAENKTQSVPLNSQKKRMKLVVAVLLVMFATSVSAIFWEDFAKKQKESGHLIADPFAVESSVGLKEKELTQPPFDHQDASLPEEIRVSDNHEVVSSFDEK